MWGSFRGRDHFRVNLGVSRRFHSLRSKRFRGVREQRKSEKRDFRCFARAKNDRRESQKEERGGGGGEGRFLSSPPPPPSFVFGSRPIFRAGKTPKILFLGLSLLPNPTETLAMQANVFKFLRFEERIIVDVRAKP